MIAIRSILDRQLTTLRQQTSQMSDVVEQSIALSLKALHKQDIGLARLVESFDKQINARRFQIEERCYELLALQQPAGSDMRAIVMTVSVVTNLERIGDYAAGIARLTQRIGERSLVEVPAEIAVMGTLTQWMVKNATGAFISRDPILAQSVRERDVELDKMQGRVYQKLIAAMTKNSAEIECNTLMLWASHNLERIGDRSATIAARVNYLVKGELYKSVENASV